MVALNPGTVESSAAILLNKARKEADYDDPFFNTPALAEDLKDFVRKLISDPTIVPKERNGNDKTYDVVENAILRGIWRDKDFKDLDESLLTHSDPNVRSLFIDCLHHETVAQYGNLQELLKRNPKLPEQLLSTVEVTKSSKSLAQVIEFFASADFPKEQKYLPDNYLSRLVSLICTNQKPEVLAAAACLFANDPNTTFSKFLHEKLGSLSKDALELKDQAILRYLLNNSPSSEVFSLVSKNGLNYLRDFDQYPGKSGLLESAMYLKQHQFNPHYSFFGLGDLFNFATNRSLSARNFSDQAAMNSIASELRSLQLDDVVDATYKVLGRSENPLALAYLEKALKPQGFFGKLVDTLFYNFSNISDNYTRKSAALFALSDNPSPLAKELCKRYDTEN